SWGYAGFRNWLKYFTVVQWDQRGAGRTFGRNGEAAASTITVERMVQDGVELAELLLKKLQKDKIVLVGHSWGSTLGVFMAKARPELFYAFVGTGQVADPARNYAVAYAALVEKPSREGNSRGRSFCGVHKAGPLSEGTQGESAPADTLVTRLERD